MGWRVGRLRRKEGGRERDGREAKEGGRESEEAQGGGAMVSRREV